MTDMDDLIRAMVKGDPNETVPLKTITDMARAVTTAGWRAPLEPEPNEPYPYGWSENRETCKRRGHRLTITTDRNAPCSSCKRRKQQATCSHPTVTARWAGILGWRYDCSTCFARMPDPDKHDAEADANG